MFDRGGRVLAVVRRSGAAITIDPSLLQQGFGLTKKEAQLASSLAAGQSLEEYSQAAGIKKETARWHMKQILQKTSCRGQADLVRRMLYQFSIGGLF